MIRATPQPERQLAPRLRFLGRPPPWSPNASQAGRVEPANLVLGRSCAAPVSSLQLSQPVHAQVDHPSINPAQSILLGWFGEQTLTPPSTFTRRPAPDGTRLEVEPPASRASLDDYLAKRLTAILQPPLSGLLETGGALEWPGALHPYQRDGVAALLSRREVLLADDMGLGKTIQAIAALRILFFRCEIENALVVCPASLVSQWWREIRKWAPDLKVVSVAGTASERGALWSLPAHVKLISYDTLRGDVLDLQDSPALRKKWSVVVLDEASRIKNPETGVTLACKRLPRDRRWALTGTPLENRIGDVISILEFLFNDRERRMPGVSNPDLVRDHLRSAQLRRKKEDVLSDLPPRQIVERIVDLSPGQREAYDRAEREGVVHLQAAGDAVTVTHVLELIARLKQICNNDPVTSESAKMADIEERLETLVEEGHRALVFSQFTDARFGVHMIAGRLQRFLPLTYTGAMSAGQKTAAVDTFLSDARHKALVLSLRAGGFGLNLQAASYVFHLDRWWNPAVEDQAESRAHRIGQHYPVTVFRYVCAGTIEERIDAKLQAKRQLFKDIVDDVSLDLSTALTEQELFGLFDLPAPRRKEPAADSPRFEGMTGDEFEQWLATQLRDVGFTVEATQASRDGGVDLIASRLDALDIESKLLIQCKNHADPVGVAVVRELRGVVPDRSAGTTAVVACPAGFTADATAFAHSTGLLLWDADDLRQIQSTGHGAPEVA